MKVISLNANGIRAAARKGFYAWLEQQNADFVCLQETKAHAAQLSPHALYFPHNYHCAYSDAEKKGYSGVAIYAKKPPLKIVQHLDFESCDTEGRYIQFDYEKFSIMSIYFPSGSSGEERQKVKFDFLQRFNERLLDIKQQGRALIMCLA